MSAAISRLRRRSMAEAIDTAQGNDHREDQREAGKANRTQRAVRLRWRGKHDGWRAYPRTQRCRSRVPKPVAARCDRRDRRVGPGGVGNRFQSENGSRPPVENRVTGVGPAILCLNRCRWRKRFPTLCGHGKRFPTPDRLFVAERQDRIDAAGAVRGDESRQRRDRRQQQHRPQRDRWVVALDAIQLGGHELAES